MELTKEYFDKKFDEQSENFISKEYLENHLDDALTEKLDGFAAKYKLSEMKSDISETKEIVKHLDKRDLEDSDLLAKSFVNHDNRLKVIEKTLGIKQAKIA